MKQRKNQDDDAFQGDLLVLKESLVPIRPDENDRADFNNEFIARSPAASMVDITPMPSSFRCLVTAQARLQMSDSGFRTGLASVGLVVVDGCLLPASAPLRAAWLATLAKVRETGEGQFFALTQHPRLKSVGIVPQSDGNLLAVRLPQSRMCSSDCVRSYAKLISLTPRETCVLDLLVQGYTPATVATELATKESTVRTQIKSVLAKSSHNSVRALLVTLACLPSMSAVALGQAGQRQELVVDMSTAHNNTRLTVSPAP